MGKKTLKLFICSITCVSPLLPEISLLCIVHAPSALGIFVQPIYMYIGYNAISYSNIARILKLLLDVSSQKEWLIL